MSELMVEMSSPVANAETKKERRSRKSKDETPPPTIIIPGRLFNSLVNQVGVGAFGIIDTLTNKNPIPTKLLGLNKEQLDDPDLVRMAEECVKAMKLQDDPITVYFGTIGLMFLTNYGMMRAEYSKQVQS